MDKNNCVNIFRFAALDATFDLKKKINIYAFSNKIMILEYSWLKCICAYHILLDNSIFGYRR